ncbi:LuxR C-terminal-related transcriptional regulator [Geodermatophilus sp. DSM 44513]|uniref:helix-turn-helix transcriptional regulator n=1 Tax=Geodermatophilus sp. DSM 44513 TaxID=1528104 RepID=UPI0012707EA2|nr:LuxR C-terminal-related transcriptional regulator [Geodermatophilus sp. DSM 44513]WNV76202.1 LuxR C-terminal-related transcriptional regulator [Geodermatophilus sp. DSM 44513]
MCVAQLGRAGGVAAGDGGDPSPGTFAVLADSAACVHRVRDLLTGHGLVPSGPRGGSRVEARVVAVVADETAQALALLARSVREQPESRHLVLTHGPVDDGFLLPVVRAGADGCLPLDLPAEAMRASLSGLLRGEAVLPRAAVGALLDELRLRPRRGVRRDDGRTVQLTEREWQVLELLSLGCRTREVAARMHVSEATVRGYLRTAVVRLRAEDRADALRVFAGAGAPGPAAPHGVRPVSRPAPADPSARGEIPTPRVPTGGFAGVRSPGR